LARALDARIGPATALRNALFELGRLLNDGKFVKFVIERRQKALLAVASTILQSMTHNRYGFAADFRVVDMVTNQARPVETLSGGETFLASLALALGLIELAGRGGGRVDSLILDEGFASLDTSALTSALDELERRAGSGKLVALVSHLGAVADMAPEVLYVLQKDGSSITRWRNHAEDDPDLDEVDARLHRV
jgi:DNA repair protein SbcC/Rad50